MKFGGYFLGIEFQDPVSDLDTRAIRLRFLLNAPDPQMFVGSFLELQPGREQMI